MERGITGRCARRMCLSLPHGEPHSITARAFPMRRAQSIAAHHGAALLQRHVMHRRCWFRFPRRFPYGMAAFKADIAQSST